MAVMNPCCCCRLQLGVTIVAIINIIGSIGMLILGILQLLVLFGVAILVFTAPNDETTNSTSTEEERKGTLAVAAAVGIVVLIFAIIFIIESILFLVASIFLFIGAQKRNMYKCRVWFVLALIFMFFYFISKFNAIIFGRTTTTTDVNDNGEVVVHKGTQVNVGAEIFEFLFVTAIVGYQLWVVYAFMEEIKAERTGNVHNAAAVHYAPPKTNDPEQPPSYGHQYTPYNPTASAGYPQAVYPPLSSDDTPPYKPTTANY